MKNPHDKYILTLIAGKLSNQDILRDLQSNSLAAPPPKELDAIRDKIKIGQESYFAGKDEVDLGWLQDLSVEAMYGYKFDKQVVESTDGIDGAFRVLNDPNMYRTITTLAMGNVTNEDIELIVNGKYDIEYSSADLDTFLKYFFNLSGWSRFEKEQYSSNVRDASLKAFYSMALEEEKDFVMWKLGVAPNKSFDAMLRDMTIDSYYNFKEHSRYNPDQAQKWGTLMLKVQERLEKVEKDLNEDQDAASDLQNAFVETLSKVMNKTEKPSKEESGTPDPFKNMDKFGREIPEIVKLEDLN